MSGTSWHHAGARDIVQALYDLYLLYVTRHLEARCLITLGNCNLAEKCCASLGQGTTRLLVTHQRHFLPQCDRVLVLRKGAIAALGTYAEVAESDLPELRGAAADEAAELDDTVYDAELGGGEEVKLKALWNHRSRLGVATRTEAARKSPPLLREIVAD